MTETQSSGCLLYRDLDLWVFVWQRIRPLGACLAETWNSRCLFVRDLDLWVFVCQRPGPPGVCLTETQSSGCLLCRDPDLWAFVWQRPGPLVVCMAETRTSGCLSLVNFMPQVSTLNTRKSHMRFIFVRSIQIWNFGLHPSLHMVYEVLRGCCCIDMVLSPAS